MNKQLQDYYENRLSMMGSQGWKDFIEDVESMIESTNKLDNVNDESSLHFKKGELSIMRWLVGLKELSQKTYEELKGE